MANVVDVANYALSKFDCVSTMKLQKIVFYSQAYHLVTRRAPLFNERIEAWVNGPVVPTLFRLHKGKFIIGSDFFQSCSSKGLTLAERHSVDHVVSVIGGDSGARLSELTHSELPWQKARGASNPESRGSNEISKRSIVEFYSSPGCQNPIFQ